MANRSQSAMNFNQTRRITPISDVDRTRVFGTNLCTGNPDFQGTPLPTTYLNPGTQNMSSTHTQSVPPPLPPRTDVSRYNRYSGYNNSLFSPYSRFSPGMYSAYGNYRSPYSRYGMPHDSYNSFIQLAEESTRPAFESIESVVDIVGSISMMLESTYHAVYSSYNAILGVVDQFSRLRDHLAEVLSFLALLRGLKYLCLKILYFLRLKKNNPSVEAAWNSAKSASEHSDFSPFHSDKKSPWPFFMFVGLVIGAPWLMFKLLARSVAKKSFDINDWKNKGGYFICTANYDFNTTRRGELSFSAGERLYVAPKNLQANVPRGWILASNKNNKVGLVPSNYLKSQQLSTGVLRVSTQKVANPIDNASQLEEVTPEKSSELCNNASAIPFAVNDDLNGPEVTPSSPVSEESEKVEN